MDKQTIKKLIEVTKTRGKLDAAKIAKIARLLTRAQLKSYLFLIKRARMTESVTVVSPLPLSAKLLIPLKKKFKDKDILVQQDESLIGGMKLYVKDTIFDATIKGTLEKIKNNIAAI